MIERDSVPDRRTGELSLLDLASLVIEQRRLVAVLVTLGIALGLAAALIPPRSYSTRISFVPEEGEGARSGLAAAASQLGLQLGTSGQSWGPPLFIELLQSSALLESVLLDSIELQEGGAPVPVLDLLEIPDGDPDRRVDLGVRALRKMTNAREVRHSGIVELTVRSRSPDLSYRLGERLLTRLQEFHQDRRRTYAGAERQFAEEQLVAAGAALASAETSLRQFLDRNRSYRNSPTLVFEHDRLMREVSLRQVLYTSLAQNVDHARMREVRNTPLISVLETPQRPALPEPRGLAVKVVLGALAGLLLGAAAAVIRQLRRGANAGVNPTPDRALRATRISVRQPVSPSAE
jgi:uncharacterized protein involved in exopolysaccharide biosynthesis